jgi:capping protein alpha
MSKATEIASAFIGGAPPGELADVVSDIKALTIENPSLHDKLGPAFQKYNEEQLATAKLPGSNETVGLSIYALLPKTHCKAGSAQQIQQTAQWPLFRRRTQL